MFFYSATEDTQEHKVFPSVRSVAIIFHQIHTDSLNFIMIEEMISTYTFKACNKLMISALLTVQFSLYPVDLWLLTAHGTLRVLTYLDLIKGHVQGIVIYHPAQ